MFKFIKKIFLFSLFLVFSYAIILFVWGTYMPYSYTPNLNYRIGSYGHMHTRLKDIEKFNDIDILFLGTSHSYRGFDNRIFKEYGYSSFNLGSSAQCPIQTRYLLNSYLEKLNPKLVVFEVFPIPFAYDGLESSLDIISNTKSVNKHLFNMMFDINHIKCYNTMLYKILRNDLLQLDDDFEEPIYRNKDTYISGGFVQKDKEVEFNSIPFNRYYKMKKLEHKQVRAFKESIDLVTKKKIPFLLVYAPITKKYYKTINSDEYNSLMEEYKQYFYDFNKIVVLDDSLHFLDYHHLNQDGVRLFNKSLAIKLDSVFHRDSIIKE